MGKSLSNYRQFLQLSSLRRVGAERSAAARLTHSGSWRGPCDNARDPRACAAANNDEGDKDVDIDELARRLSSEAQRMREGSDAESAEPPTPPVSWTRASGMGVPVRCHPEQTFATSPDPFHGQSMILQGEGSE